MSDATAPAGTGKLDCIGQIAITVGDLARSRDFYKNTLGVKHLFDAGNMAFFQCGDVRLLIAVSHDPVRPGGTILYFKVSEIHAAYARLLGQGIAFTSPPHLVAKTAGHDLWMAFFKDPDGHTLGMMSEHPGHA